MTDPSAPQTASLLLATKLHRPRASAPLVPRPRLLEELTAGWSRRLTLVSAPAGYGKTTLVNLWLETVECPSTWLSLDEHDADLDSFTSYLLAALRTAYPQAGQAIASLLQAPELPPPNRVADVLLRDLEQLPGPLVLVLDDYHTVSTPPINTFMARLVQRLPDDLHLVLITRTDPPLRLAQLRGRRQLDEVRSASLRFTAEETAELLRQALDEPVADEIVALLAERTEGWAVGLQLAALSLRESPDRQDFARRFAQSGHRLATDYLLNEVLEELPDAQRTLMLQTSILERFCAPLCQAIAGSAAPPGGGEAFVADLWRSNLFLAALDDEGLWYRYHHLLRDLLYHRLRQAYTAEAIAGLHRRASAWFEAHGLLEEAITHAVQAGDALAAAQLVEAHIHDALNQESWHRLERWLGLLPPEVRQRPGLLVAQAFLYHFRNRVAAMMPLLEAAEAGLAAGAGGYTPAEQEGWLGAINALAATTFVKGSLERGLHRANLALAQLGPEAVFARGLAEFWVITGLQQTGRSDEALAMVNERLHRQPIQPDIPSLRLLLALCAIHYHQADLPALQAAASTFHQMAVQANRPISKAWASYCLGWAAYQRNDLEAAERWFGEVVALCYEANSRAAVDSFTGLAWAQRAQGRPQAAETTVLALRSFLSERGHVNLMPVADSLSLRLELNWQGTIAPASFVADPESQLALDLWELPVLTAIRCYIAAGGPDQLARAGKLLATCRAEAGTRHAQRRQIEIATLECLLYGAQGNDQAAVDVLRDAVLLGEPGGALRLFVDAGPGLMKHFQQLVHEGSAGAYVQRILAAYAASTPQLIPQALAALPSPERSMERLLAAEELAGRLTNREIDILLLLERRLTNQEIASYLTISPDTVRKHTMNLYQKLQAGNRRQAVAKARSLGILPPTPQIS